MPELYGIIGFPLGHSFSPAFFRKKFEAEGIRAAYELFPLEKIEALPELIQTHPKLRGLNVTAPYKAAVIPFLDSISEDALAIGAVNCIAVQDGKLHGFNTDWKAFADSLSVLCGTREKPALVLGNGGAASAVRYAFGHLEIPCATVCRRPAGDALPFEAMSADRLRQYRLIVNATPLGTLGEGRPSLPYEALESSQMLYDLVYNPPLTPFLEEGLMRGLAVKNGLEILQRQAMLSWEIWQRRA